MVSTPDGEHLDGKLKTGSSSGPSSLPEVEKGAVAPDGPINPARNPDTTIAILDLVKANDAHHPMNVRDFLSAWISSSDVLGSCLYPPDMYYEERLWSISFHLS